SEVKTAGIGVMRVPKAHRTAWFTEMIKNLAHNRPLDIAVNTASRMVPSATNPLPPPFLAASHDLAELAQLEAYAHRLIAYLQSSKITRTVKLTHKTASELQLPARSNLFHLGEALQINFSDYKYRFLHEHGDATGILNLRMELESELRTS